MEEAPRDLKPNVASDRILRAFFIFSLMMVGLSLVIEPIDTILPRLMRICFSPIKLLTDTCVIGGTNGALLNAGLIGLVTWAIFYFSRVKITGMHIGAYLHGIGITFYGKNIVNFWPLLLGVYLYARVKKEPFQKHAHTAIFSGALSACVSEIAFSDYLNLPLFISLPIGILLGIVIGFVIVPLSAHTIRMHKGYNLYNTGLAAGLIAFILYSIYRTLVLAPMGILNQFTLNAAVSNNHATVLISFFGSCFLYCLVRGFFLNGRSFSGYGRLFQTTGYREDYLSEFGLPLVLINFGVLGLISLTYFVFIGANITGLTIGAILCLVCWCALGSTPRNLPPILLGYTLVSFFATWSLDNQLICIGLCFATGLCPIAGRYGFLAGLIAGGLHACCVSYTAVFHGGFNLYNGGFTSGLVAMVLVPILESLLKARENVTKPLGVHSVAAPDAIPADARNADGKESVPLE